MRGIARLVSLSDEEKSRIGLLHTAKEIRQQPGTWLKTLTMIMDNRARLENSLTEVFDGDQEVQVVLAGAGTSYYAALCAQPLWRQNVSHWSEAWPTTRILTEPSSIISPNHRMLLVSLARSGNNPETLGSVKHSRELSSRPYQLAITCNKDSYLGNLQGTLDDAITLTLPPETLDQGLAMTSSFTNLVLAAQLVAEVYAGSEDFSVIAALSDLAERLLRGSHEFMQFVDQVHFNRVFVMGDGSLYGAALETLLKFEEFSDGAIMGIAESFLGARHGTSNAINDSTLVIYLVSSDPVVRQYQTQVMAEIAERRPRAKALAVTLHDDPALHSYAEHVIVLDETGLVHIPDLWRAPLDVVAMQCLTLQSALKLGVNPDSPFKKRATARAIEAIKPIG